MSDGRVVVRLDGVSQMARCRGQLREAGESAVRPGLVCCGASPLRRDEPHASDAGQHPPGFGVRKKSGTTIRGPAHRAVQGVWQYSVF